MLDEVHEIHDEILCEKDFINKNAQVITIKEQNNENPKKIFDINYLQAYIHLYRGEIGKQVSYRMRLDNTTYWSFILTVSLTTFALGNDNIEHFFYFPILFLCCVFLIIESRRYRYYAISRNRVKILEKGFYGEIFKKNQNDSDWTTEIYSSLLAPVHVYKVFDSIILRLTRTYIYLIIFIIMCWAIKLGKYWYIFVAVVILLFIIQFLLKELKTKKMRINLGIDV